jgi:glutamate dehydrogenase (NADP+)
MTGKGLNWGGVNGRPQAAGYGCVYFASEMLATRGQTLEGKTCLVSGSGNVSQYVIEKILRLGGKVLTVSDSNGFIFDGEGIDAGKLAFIMELKNLRRGRIKVYADKYKSAAYTPVDHAGGRNPLWDHKADCAFPCATQNEINAEDARRLLKNGVSLVAEGAHRPTRSEGVKIFLDAGILYAPGKAAGAGGAAISGLEMAQNSMRMLWTKEEMDKRLGDIIKNIHSACLQYAERFGTPGNYVNGANIGGFLKVADAMMDQGLI